MSVYFYHQPPLYGWFVVYELVPLDGHLNGLQLFAVTDGVMVNLCLCNFIFSPGIYWMPLMGRALHDPQEIQEQIWLSQLSRSRRPCSHLGAVSRMHMPSEPRKMGWGDVGALRGAFWKLSCQIYPSFSLARAWWSERIFWDRRHRRWRQLALGRHPADR